MAALWQGALVPWLDASGDPYASAKVYFFDANTTTPMVVYADPSLSTPRDHPTLANGSGQFPPIFMVEGSTYRVRIEDSDGATIWDVDGISVPIISPPEIPSGDTPIELLARTGDFKHRYDAGTHSGWVRSNGRTIGDASSSATERANADCENLFKYLWPFTELTVSGGRGVSAAADWAASKTIALPDLRGRALIGLDGMGNSRANQVADALTPSTADTLGATSGASTIALIVSEMPSHNHGGVTSTGGVHDHTIGDAVFAGTGSGTVMRQFSGAGATVASAANGNHNHTISSQGGGAAHVNMQPSRFVTIYIKL